MKEMVNRCSNNNNNSVFIAVLFRLSLSLFFARTQNDPYIGGAIKKSSLLNGRSWHSARCWQSSVKIRTDRGRGTCARCAELVWMGAYYHVSTPRSMRFPYVSDGKYTIFYVIDLYATEIDRRENDMKTLYDGSGCSADSEKKNRRK